MNMDVLGKSILVVAHPDDEILWFSSILTHVDHIILCYLGELVNPPFGEQRRAVLDNYPLQDKMSCLEIVSLGLSRPRNFDSPQFSQFGIEFTDDRDVEPRFIAQYQENYVHLKSKLASQLSGYDHVFTHNPWGEYGHEEHVQVYRVIQDLQKDMGFGLLYSNYCSTRTVHLTSILADRQEVGTWPSDPSIAQTIQDVYERTDTWTWYDNWTWPAQETFFQESPSSSASVPPGRLLSINMVVMPALPPKRRGQPSRVARLKQFLGV